MNRIDNAIKLLIPMILAGAVGCSTLHKSDSATLQGTWKGQETGGRTEGYCYLTISGNTLHFQGANSDEWYKGTFTLREDTKPKQVAATITECQAPQYIGKITHAIYKLEAGTLTMTGNEPGNPEVPAGFAAPGTRQFVLKKN